MTDAEINQTIAECCGRAVCVHNPSQWERRGPEGDSELYCVQCKKYLHDMRVPNYCTDLNAMHDAEQTLRNGEYEVFRAALGAAVKAAHSTEILRVRSTISATARQRAEAFISAIRPSARLTLL